MIHNLYLILAVGFRTLALWWVARAVVGLIATAVFSGGMGGVFAPFIGFLPTLVGGVLLWLFATQLAAVITKGIE